MAELEKLIQGFVRDSKRGLSYTDHIEEIHRDLGVSASDEETLPSFLTAQAIERLKKTGKAEDWLYVPATHTLNAMKVDGVILAQGYAVPIQIAANDGHKKKILRLCTGTIPH